VILYLHGFASSAQSTKATFFASRLADLGVAVQTPDFNHPDFSTLTVRRMIGQVTRAIDAAPGEPVTLIGSSLGGFVAIQAALQRPGRVVRLILLAPALDLSDDRLRELGDRDVEEWQRTNQLNVFHYGYGRTVPIHYELYEDVRRYDALDAVLPMPIQVFQGRRDAAVDPATVERWANARSNVELHLLDDDHQLAASLPYIWEKTSGFLTSRSPSTEPGPLPA
jgi:uncharacterized protein